MNTNADSMSSGPLLGLFHKGIEVDAWLATIREHLAGQGKTDQEQKEIFDSLVKRQAAYHKSLLDAVSARRGVGECNEASPLALTPEQVGILQLQGLLRKLQDAFIGMQAEMIKQQAWIEAVQQGAASCEVPSKGFTHAMAVMNKWRDENHARLLEQIEDIDPATAADLDRRRFG